MRPDPLARAPAILRLGAAALLVSLVGLVYSGSLRGPFVLDDVETITGNPTIRHFSTALSPPAGNGMTVEGRPVLNLSLAFNYAFGGTSAFGYHLTNLVIHVLGTLALWGILRRHLAPAAAFAAALFWAVHPLNTEAVTYVIQRAESLMGLCYLATLYGFIRSTDAGSGPWVRSAFAGLSIGACLLGMGTKEVMVSAPVIVLLYDRTFRADGFGSALRQRPFYYGWLAATWIPLVLEATHSGSRGGTVGFTVGVDALRYWVAQGSVTAHYLRLALWPHPLVFDYGTAWDPGIGATLFGLFGLGALLAATITGLVRRRAWGFAGAFFCCVLAPTALIPSSRQTLAEHRMYLALIPVVVLLVAGINCWLARLPRRGRIAGLVAAAFVAVSLGAATRARNQVYGTAVGLYSDSLRHQPRNGWNEFGLANALWDDGRSADALPHDQAAVALLPGAAAVHGNLGNAYLRLGHVREAVFEYQTEVRLDPLSAAAHGNLGGGLVAAGRFAEAVPEFETALRQLPERAELHSDYGVALAHAGRTDESIVEFKHALALDPHRAATYANLGGAYLTLDRPKDAFLAYREAIRLRPDEAMRHFYDALLDAKTNQPAAARAEAAEALRLRPDFPQATALLRGLEDE